jgi:hypothetical protein
MRLDDAAKLGFSIAVENAVVNLKFLKVGGKIPH